MKKESVIRPVIGQLSAVLCPHWLKLTLYSSPWQWDDDLHLQKLISNFTLSFINLYHITYSVKISLSSTSSSLLFVSSVILALKVVGQPISKKNNVIHQTWLFWNYWTFAFWYTSFVKGCPKCSINNYITNNYFPFRLKSISIVFSCI